MTASPAGFTQFFALTCQKLGPAAERGPSFPMRDGPNRFAGFTPMTVMFDIACHSVFSSARLLDVGAPSLAVDGATVTLRQAVVFSSDPDLLDRTEGRNYVFVAALDIDGVEDQTEASKSISTRFGRPEGKLALLEALGLGDLARSLIADPDRIMAHNSWTIPRAEEDLRLPLTTLFAFFFYGWVILMRIERFQMQMPLSQADNPANNRNIIKQRLRLLNFTRYFRTDHITNHALLQQYRRDLGKKMRFEDRYAKISATHNSFEHHLDNISKTSQNQKLGSVSNLILLLTVLSVPIGFISAAVAINFASPIFRETFAILLDPRLYVLVLTGAALVLVPLMLLKLIDRYLGWRRKRRSP